MSIDVEDVEGVDDAERGTSLPQRTRADGRPIMRNGRSRHQKCDLLHHEVTSHPGDIAVKACPICQIQIYTPLTYWPSNIGNVQRNPLVGGRS